MSRHRTPGPIHTTQGHGRGRQDLASSHLRQRSTPGHPLGRGSRRNRNEPQAFACRRRLGGQFRIMATAPASAPAPALRTRTRTQAHGGRLSRWERSRGGHGRAPTQGFTVRQGPLGRTKLWEGRCQMPGRRLGGRRNRQPEERGGRRTTRAFALRRRISGQRIPRTRGRRRTRGFTLRRRIGGWNIPRERGTRLRQASALRRPIGDRGRPWELVEEERGRRPAPASATRRGG
jgi:hypothetical protein